MFEKTMVRLMLAALAVATMPAEAAKADVILPTGLAPGSEHQIAFLTSGTTTAISPNNDDYNIFVTQHANLGPALAALGAGNSLPLSL
ncbi:MAG: hypothetical protein ABSG53_10310 [Thermoguttaceae bacterium]